MGVGRVGGRLIRKNRKSQEHNISGTGKDIDLTLSGHIELNMKTLCFTRFYICNKSGRANGITLKLLGHIKLNKKHHMYRGCQNGVSTISLEELKVLSWRFQACWGGCWTRLKRAYPDCWTGPATLSQEG